MINDLWPGRTWWNSLCELHESNLNAFYIGNLLDFLFRLFRSVCFNWMDGSLAIAGRFLWLLSYTNRKMNVTLQFGSANWRRYLLRCRVWSPCVYSVRTCSGYGGGAMRSILMPSNGGDVGIVHVNNDRNNHASWDRKWMGCFFPWCFCGFFHRRWGTVGGGRIDVQLPNAMHSHQPFRLWACYRHPTTTAHFFSPFHHFTAEFYVICIATGCSTPHRFFPVRFVGKNLVYF